MNNNEAPAYSYSILHPNALTRYTPEGYITVLAMTDGAPYGITVSDYRELESLGFITIHSVGGNDLAESYGRTRIHYTINN